MKTKIEYVQDDFFNNIPEKPEIPILIPHCCNNIKVFGGGFTFGLNKKWPIVAKQFYEFSSTFQNPIDLLGENQYIKVEKDITVVNMFGQNGIIGVNNSRPVVYSAIAKCMEEIAGFKKKKDFEIMTVKFGSGLANGNWDLISLMIKEIWCYVDIPVTIFSP